jgi:hypothetical protein
MAAVGSLELSVGTKAACAAVGDQLQPQFSDQVSV